MHESTRRAHKLLARLADAEQCYADDLATRDPSEPDAMDRWDAMRPKREPVRPVRQFTDTEAEQLRAYTRSLVDALSDAVAEVTGSMAREHDKELKRLEGEIASLRSDIAILNRHKAGGVTPIRGRDAA